MTPTPVLTVPALFALSQGARCEGKDICAFCGSPCGPDHSTKPFKDKIKITAAMVTAGQKQSESTVCCKGCFLSFREKVTVNFPPIPPETKPQREDQACVANYSWFITHELATAYQVTGKEDDNQTHRKFLREALLNPPKSEWAAVLVKNPKEPNFWRGRVNDLQAPPYMVLLDKELISYKPADLQKRLELVGKINAVVHNCNTIDEFHDAFMARYVNGAELQTQWREVKNDGLSKLADFLSWPAHECDEKFPAENFKKSTKPSLAEVGEAK